METVEHFVMKCEGIRTIRERHEVRGGVRTEDGGDFCCLKERPRKRFMDIRKCWRRCGQREKN